MAIFSEKNSVDNRSSNYLPDFCDADVFLRLILVIELMAIAFALVSYEGEQLFVHIAMISVVMQWSGLGAAAILCGVSRLGWLNSTLSTTLVAFAVVLFVTGLVSLASVKVDDIFSLSDSNMSVSYVVLRNLAVSAILAGMAMRYFYFQAESRRHLEMQARTRLQALQARIRPHFLFNSMNTIASLTHDQPDLAEEAIENLSDLFRASLAAEDSISLQQELELTRHYVDLEQLRLGDRLEVRWTLVQPLPKTELPALTLQPLVENAIYHGVEPLPEGGTVDITVESAESSLTIMISNPLTKTDDAIQRSGNQMAVENIRERLELAFAGAARMRVDQANNRFTVTLILPIA